MNIFTKYIVNLLGQHIGVLTNPLEYVVPALPRYLETLGINCREPNSTSSNANVSLLEFRCLELVIIKRFPAVPVVN